jgi:hypothetical protein
MTVIPDNREHELETAKTIQKFVDDYLLLSGITPVDGLRRGTCQTGEEYVEITVSAANDDILARALAGAIAGFGGRGDRCYWRVRADVEERLGQLPRCYMRFCVTGKPELDDGRAA